MRMLRSLSLLSFVCSCVGQGAALRQEEAAPAVSPALPAEVEADAAVGADDPWVCPPCGVGCDDAEYAESGSCPVCAMALMPASQLRRVAVVLWDGIELLDFGGPAEVFQCARSEGGEAFLVYTVASSREPIVSQAFLDIVPDYSVDDAPMPDIVVLSGGGVAMARQDEELVRWLREVTPHTEVDFSVATGCFFWADLGMLDGLRATTWHGALDALERVAPNTRVLRRAHFVDEGHVVTAAGVSAGIDAALHVVGRLIGDEAAHAAARYMQYDWRHTNPAEEL